MIRTLLIVLMLGAFSGFAQAPLMIQGQTGSLYLMHSVVAKENWYSVGRMYNLSPKDIAAYNSLTIDKPLEIAQELKIPLVRANFSQDGQKGADETFVPVYHILQPKEWIYRVSVNYNAVPVAFLEKWNNINKDQAKSGTKLIVGYLKVKTASSPLAAGGVDHVTVLKAKEDKAKDDSKNIKEETKTAETSLPAAKPEKKALQVIDKPLPAKPETKTANNDASQVADRQSKTSSVVHTTGGYFESEFDDGTRSLSGTASTFKSTSGWQDAKYYALMNNVPVGTIVKVISGSTHKFIYAKVLGQLPDMKESAGLTIRISNAASGELGEGEGKFNVDIKY